MLVGLVVVAAVAVGAFVLLGGDGGGGGGDTAGQVLAADPTACPGAPSICITSLRAVDEGLLATFETAGVELSQGGVHAEFFLTDDPQGAISWFSADPFGTGGRGFTAREASTRSLCVVLADANNRVAAGTGNCVEVPSVS